MKFRFYCCYARKIHSRLCVKDNRICAVQEKILHSRWTSFKTQLSQAAYIQRLSAFWQVIKTVYQKSACSNITLKELA